MNPLPHSLESKLRPYQVQPARQLFRALTCGAEEWGYNGGVDMSAVGVGKTAMDLAAMLATGNRVGVIAPPVGHDGWREMFGIFGAEPAWITSYEALRSGLRPQIARILNGRFHWQSENIGVILDEFQAGRNPDSLTTSCIEGLLAAKIPAIAASATLAISPIELFAAGQLVGLHKGDEDWRFFLASNGCRFDEVEQRWKFNQNLRHLHEIHAKIIPLRGCRVTKADMGPQFGTTITVLPIAVPEGEEIEQQWKDANEVVDRLEQQGANKQYILNSRRCARIAIWKRCEMALVAPVAELIKRDLDEEKSVVVFFSFTESRLAMGRLLNRHEGFFGGQNAKIRSHYMKEFQNNKLHVLLSNIGAGGASVSLHDIHGKRPRVSYLFPTDNPVKMGQAPGRIDRAGGMSHSVQWIPCVAGTLSERMVAQTARKMARMAALNNGAVEINQLTRLNR